MISLTIAIPTLNCARTLPETLVSLLPLARAGATLRVVDSYSTDGTPEIARQFNVPVEQVAPGNMYAAVNAGLSGHSGEWCTYINGDDLLYADAIANMLNAALPAEDVLYGNVDFIDGAGRFLHGWRSASPEDYLALAASRLMPVPQFGTLFRRAVFDQLNGFDLAFKYAADFDFLLRASLAGFRFAKHERSSVSAFRLHHAQISQAHKKEMLAEAGMSIARNRLRIAGWRRVAALWSLRFQNWDGYVLRVLRWRQLTGAWKPRSCLAVQ